jgi:predicted GH43/DUF377 family glycosyl hydrolase
LCVLAIPLFGELIDLDENPHDFVLDTKRIEIPNFPHAFNPSIIRWDGRLLLSFRNLPPQADKMKFNSDLYLIWLDDDFNPVSAPQLLEIRRPNDPTHSRAEDPRLVLIDKQLYIIYSDNTDLKITAKGFRMYRAELYHIGDKIIIQNLEKMSEWAGQNPERREKNWVPFDHKGQMLLAYNLSPHHILRPIFGTDFLEELSCSNSQLDWKWGWIRGGTPAIQIGDEYLSLFHSQIKMTSVHSQGKEMLHYFMGAYTFSSEYPFKINKISPEPIRGKDFYHGLEYERYWGSIRVVFPCGLIVEDPYIYVSYGRQDHELWVAKMDKEKLLNSLKPCK